MPDGPVPVHGRIGGSNRRLSIHAPSKSDGAESEADRNGPALPYQRIPCRHAPYARARGVGLFLIRMQQHNSEFVPAEASHEIAATKRRKQNGREMREKGIAAGMSMRVIRVFQPVKIDIGERRSRGVA